jgi:hypothetical protein
MSLCRDREGSKNTKTHEENQIVQNVFLRVSFVLLCLRGYGTRGSLR